MLYKKSVYQFSSVTQLCLTLDPTDCSTPGFPVHHQLPEWSIQPSHPLSSLSPPTFNLHHKWLQGSHSMSFNSLQLHLTLRPTDCSMPGLPVHHQLPEFTQTHVHRVGDAIQPSHPLSSPSPPTSNLSQHHSLFK